MIEANRQKTSRFLLSLLLFSFGAGSGCIKGMQPASVIDETGEIRIEVSVGDTVRVLTKYGERPIFEVTEIGPEAMVGAGRQIPYADMVFVEKLSASPVESAVVALSIADGVVRFLAVYDLLNP